MKYLTTLIFTILITFSSVVNADSLNYLVLLSTKTGAEWVSPNHIESVNLSDNKFTIYLSSGRTLELNRNDLLHFSKLTGLSLKPF